MKFGAQPQADSAQRRNSDLARTLHNENLVMKALKALVKVVLCGICAFGLTSPAGALVQTARTGSQELGTSFDQDSINGKVTSKTENSVTVDGKTIATTTATVISKNGKPGTVADVNVGSTVKVNVKKGEDGGLQALMIEVTGKPEGDKELKR